MSEEISLHGKVFKNYSKHDSHLKLITNLWHGVGNTKVDAI